MMPGSIRPRKRSFVFPSVAIDRWERSSRIGGITHDCAARPIRGRAARDFDCPIKMGKRKWQRRSPFFSLPAGLLLVAIFAQDQDRQDEKEAPGCNWNEKKI